MSKKIIFTIVIVVITLGAGSYFWLDQKQAGKQSGGSVTIGALVPITGELAAIGESMRNAMELAKEDLVAEGVVTKLDIIYEDVCDEASALTAVKKLLEVDKVKVIGSSFCVSGLEAILPLTEANKVIVFNTAANPPSVLNKKYGFSTNIAVFDESEAIAEYAFDQLHAKTAAIIHFDTGFGIGARDGFTTRFETLGGKIVYVKGKPFGTSDHQTDMTEIKTLNPDVLFITHFSSPLGSAVKQARAAGVTSVIMGNYETEDHVVVRVAREATEGMIFSSLLQSVKAAKTKNVLDFEKRYQEQFGELPDVLAGNAYDAVKLQVITFVACKGDTDCMARNFLKVKEYDGVSGMITIKKDHSVEKSLIFKKIIGGKFVEIE